ncbi:MAG: hypothetical protein AB202_00410 [Parcubacteria bacterium C7867-007]|nr:MAG: hypothetical protein AB202_00410 [Parcubacteria bacterium C7867-007]
MSSIRIIKTPPGTLAPVGVRKQWVGVIIPLVTEEELRANPIAGTIGNQNRDGYIVLRSKAIAALRAADREGVATYWEHIPLGMYLQFHKNVCELV